MKTIIQYNKFFAFSESKNKYFQATFDDGLNIIYGKNTSGKSTLLQSILYTFGINSEKNKLTEILNDNVIFRLDFTLTTMNSERVSVVRSNEELVIKRENGPAVRFIGISGDSSFEHIKLKEYLGKLFGFNLSLNSSGTYKQAPLEAFFLPYYVAQDIGWVYPFKSFKGLDYVKGFKRDFFDYLLGLTSRDDIEIKLKLEAKKREHDAKKDFLRKSIKNDIKFEIAQAKDENFIEKANEFLSNHKETKEALVKDEGKTLVVSNKISLLQRRRKLLHTIRRELQKQEPATGTCPTCLQNIPNSLEEHYDYFQNTHDTDAELASIGQQLKKLASENNSNEKRISGYKKEIKRGHEALKEYLVDEVSFANWLDRKTDIKLLHKTQKSIGKLEILSSNLAEKIKEYDDAELQKSRYKCSANFKNSFQLFLAELGVMPFEDNRYLLLYQIPGFPKQGAELLKTLLAFYFAFNKLTSFTPNIHRCPLLLDSVFEGDLEDDSKNKVLNFIKAHRPKDTQLFITIADDVTNKNPVEDYNKTIFNGEAELICIGDNKNERAFLVDFDERHRDYLEETFKLLEEI